MGRLSGEFERYEIFVRSRLFAAAATPGAARLAVWTAADEEGAARTSVGLYDRARGSWLEPLTAEEPRTHLFGELGALCAGGRAPDRLVRQARLAGELVSRLGR